MSLLRVWAPKASRVEVVVGDQRRALLPDGDGYFRLPGTQLPPGTDYGFSLDGGPPLPDPRSRFQPQGVHGLSRVPDPEFRWTDAMFRAPPLSSGVLYEVHVGTFAADGTFDGVVERIPHLVALGVTHIELMPVAEFPGTRGWGYDGVALYAPHHAYGGPLGLKRLVDACHANGIGVVLDVVYNHLGPDGNYLPQYGPYLTDAHRTPWGSAVNLDGPSSEPVRRFFLENALYWLEEFHIDGLRLDAVHALHDRSATHFLAELADEVNELSDRLGKPFSLIAESDLNDPRIVRHKEAFGFGFDAVYNDDFHHALHVSLTHERQGYYADFDGLPALTHALEHGFVYEGEASGFRKQKIGQPLGKIPLKRLLGFMQNHDQVGNRARGERLHHLVSERRVRLGAAVVLLGPFLPMLFQGEEWAARAPFLYFTDHEDPNLGRAVSEGRSREFAGFGFARSDIPDPQALETFRSSVLDFAELRLPEHRSMFEFYQSLIRIRRTNRELSTPRMRARCQVASGLLVLERESSQVLLNFGAETLEVPLSASPASRWEVALTVEGVSLQSDRCSLPAESLAVVISRQT